MFGFLIENSEYLKLVGKKRRWVRGDSLPYRRKFWKYYYYS